MDLTRAHALVHIVYPKGYTDMTSMVAYSARNDAMRHVASISGYRSLTHTALLRYRRGLRPAVSTIPRMAYKLREEMKDEETK
jgi:hypothetical protein